MKQLHIVLLRISRNNCFGNSFISLSPDEFKGNRFLLNENEVGRFINENRFKYLDTETDYVVFSTKMSAKRIGLLTNTLDRVPS